MIKKLKLNLADLQVNTFVIHSEANAEGTVLAHESEAGTCTTCWGDSRDCTQNPANAECAMSQQYCSAAEPCWVTKAEYGYYGCG
jgi:hypothetical protein